MKNRDHLFKKGQSGNPKGRPRGIVDSRLALKKLLDPHKEELLDIAMGMARDGNEAMIKLLLDRLLPAKPKDNPIRTGLTSKSDTKEQSVELLQKIHDGELSPLEGFTALQALNSHDTIKNNSEAVQMALELARKKT